jgi:hypothetical protein
VLDHVIKAAEIRVLVTKIRYYDWIGQNQYWRYSQEIKCLFVNDRVNGNWDNKRASFRTDNMYCYTAQTYAVKSLGWLNPISR